jgi:ubiquitin carboxyl-terminal hydrolase 2/21
VCKSRQNTLQLRSMMVRRVIVPWRLCGLVPFVQRRLTIKFSSVLAVSAIHSTNAPCCRVWFDGAGDSAKQKADRWWKNYTDRNDSFLVDLLAGQLQSTLTCQTCGNSSVVYDPFWDLSLPIPKDKTYASASESSFGANAVEAYAAKHGGGGGPRKNDPKEQLAACRLSDCFRFFTTPEVLQEGDSPYCSRCKTHRQFTKKMLIFRLPEILVVHLKRFMYNKFSRDKITTDVQFPLEKLNLQVRVSAL